MKRCKTCNKIIKKGEAEYKYQGENNDKFSCYECFDKREQVKKERI